MKNWRKKLSIANAFAGYKKHVEGIAFIASLGSFIIPK